MFLKWWGHVEGGGRWDSSLTHMVVLMAGFSTVLRTPNVHSDKLTKPDSHRWVCLEGSIAGEESLSWAPPLFRSASLPAAALHPVSPSHSPSSPATPFLSRPVLDPLQPHPHPREWHNVL